MNTPMTSATDNEIQNTDDCIIRSGQKEAQIRRARRVVLMLTPKRTSEFQFAMRFEETRI